MDISLRSDEEKLGRANTMRCFQKKLFADIEVSFQQISTTADMSSSETRPFLQFMSFSGYKIYHFGDMTISGT